MSGTGPLLEVDGLVKHFPLNRSVADVLRGEPPRAVHAVDGVSLFVRRRETLGLIGESGSGKTTLGWLIAKLHEPTAGRIRYNGKDVTHASGRALKEWRRRVQI
ncbi:MAG: ATP-binding cassette domain-containing protein, partial [Candidatus Lutacidiplasmatales archaeon]